MPKFICKNCNTKIEASDEHIGKKLKCPKCVEILTIPDLTNFNIDKAVPKQVKKKSPESYNLSPVDNSDDLDDLVDFEDIPCETQPHIKKPKKKKEKSVDIEESFIDESKIALAIGAMLIIFITGFFIWFFNIRSTWESDNYQKICDKNESVRGLLSTNKPEECVMAYEELLTLIGNRKLHNNILANDFNKTKELLDPLKLKFDQVKIVKQAREMESKADSLASTGDLQHAINIYETSLQLIKNLSASSEALDHAYKQISKSKLRTESKLNQIIEDREKIKKERMASEIQSKKENRNRLKGVYIEACQELNLVIIEVEKLLYGIEQNIYNIAAFSNQIQMLSNSVVKFNNWKNLNSNITPTDYRYTDAISNTKSVLADAISAQKAWHDSIYSEYGKYEAKLLRDRKIESITLNARRASKALKSYNNNEVYNED